MSGELDEAGALVTAALAAGEVERASLPRMDPKVAAGPCSNCGAVLIGPYCHTCGQAAHLHRSLFGLIEEVLHRVLHLEAKGWRTLPLLILQPGVLTRRYIEGQRTRYVSPLSLFLFNTFLMFFVFSLTLGTRPSTPLSAAQRAQAHAELMQQSAASAAAVAREEAALAQARARGEGVGGAASKLAAAKATERITAAAAQAVATGGATPLGSVQGHSVVTLPLSALLPSLDAHTGFAAFDMRWHRALANPELFLYRLQGNVYKYSFMLIPISLPFLWLLFVGRPAIRMYDHAVFALYSLSFMSLLLSVVALLGVAGRGALAGGMLVTIAPLHMFTQLRRTYGLRAGAALWRTAALLCVAGTAFVIFLLAIALLTLH